MLISSPGRQLARVVSKLLRTPKIRLSLRMIIARAKEQDRQHYNATMVCLKGGLTQVPTQYAREEIAALQQMHTDS